MKKKFGLYDLWHALQGKADSKLMWIRPVLR